MSTAEDRRTFAVQLLQDDRPAAAAVLLMHGDLMELDNNIAALLSESQAERAEAEGFLGSQTIFQPETLALRLALVICTPTSPSDLRLKSADVLLELLATTRPGSISPCLQFCTPVVNTLKNLLLKGFSSRPGKDTLTKIRDAIYHLSQTHPWPELLSKVFWFASPVHTPEVQEAAFILLASFPRSEHLISRAREIHALVYLAQSSSSLEVRVAALGAGGNICLDMEERNLMMDVLPSAKNLSLELKTSGFLSCANRVNALEAAISTIAVVEDQANRVYAMAIINEYIDALRSSKLVCSVAVEDDEHDDNDDKVLLGQLKAFSSMAISPINAFSAFGIAIAYYASTKTSESHQRILVYCALVFLSFSLLGYAVVSAVEAMKKPKPGLVCLCIWIVVLKVLYVKIYASMLGVFVAKAEVWSVFLILGVFAASVLVMVLLTTKRPRWILDFLRWILKKLVSHKQ